MQAREKTESPPGLNIEPDEDTLITSGLTSDDDEDDDDTSLLGGASIALDPAEDKIYIIGENTSRKGGDLYPTGDESLGASTTRGYTSSLKVKRAMS